MMGREEGGLDKIHGLWRMGRDVSFKKQERGRKE